MRKVAAWLGLAAALGAIPAAAQTCPPNDPLCTSKNSPTKTERQAESPAPAPSPAPATPPPKVSDEKEKKPEAPASARGVITLAEVTITGRVQKPIAAVDVGRIAPKLTLSVLRQPFLERIEKVIYSDPF